MCSSCATIVRTGQRAILSVSIVGIGLLAVIARDLHGTRLRDVVALIGAAAIMVFGALQNKILYDFAKAPPTKSQRGSPGGVEEQPNRVSGLLRQGGKKPVR
jgi:hypothetical protein